jgi:hypothetical protein
MNRCTQTNSNGMNYKENSWASLQLNLSKVFLLVSLCLSAYM